MNLSVLRGSLTAAPTVTELGDGTVVHNFELRTEVDGERLVVPVAWYSPARPPRLGPGDTVVVIGRVRRRWYRAQGGSQSRTEVRATTVARPHATTAARAIRGALAELESSAAGD